LIYTGNIYLKGTSLWCCCVDVHDWLASETFTWRNTSLQCRSVPIYD